MFEAKAHNLWFLVTFSTHLLSNYVYMGTLASYAYDKSGQKITHNCSDVLWEGLSAESSSVTWVTRTPKQNSMSHFGTQLFGTTHI